MLKRRKTITTLDNSDYKKNITDQYYMNIELIKEPVIPPVLISDYTYIILSFINYAILYTKFRPPRNITLRIVTLLKDYLELAEKVKTTYNLIDKICLY